MYHFVRSKTRTILKIKIDTEMALPDSSSHNLLRTINRLSLKRYNNKMQKLTLFFTNPEHCSSIENNDVQCRNETDAMVLFFIFIFLTKRQKWSSNTSLAVPGNVVIKFLHIYDQFTFSML